MSKAFVPEPVEGGVCEAVAAAAGPVVIGGGERRGSGRFLMRHSRSIAANASLIWLSGMRPVGVSDEFAGAATSSAAGAAAWSVATRLRQAGAGEGSLRLA